jgi:hypothetical protein
MVFSYFWVGWVVKTTLAPKFGSLVQKWGRAGFGKGGAWWNPGPPFSPLTSLLFLPPSSSPLPPPPPKAKGKGRRKGGRAWRRGMHGLGPCTTPSLGCPPKLLLKLDHFSISFGDFSFFL